MTDMFCGYPGDRDETLIAYLYDDIDAGARAARFDAHLATCARCRDELAALRGVRAQLARWAPPEPSFAVVSRQSPVASPARPQSIRSPQWWREIPAWAQVAAALLFLGVSAGIANLDVRYDSERPERCAPAGRRPPARGRGRSSGAASVRASGRLVARGSRRRSSSSCGPNSAPLQAALGQRGGCAASAPAAADADVVRRVRALVDESEKRQQRELALRVGEADPRRQRAAAGRSGEDRSQPRASCRTTLGVEVMQTGSS